MVTDRARGRTTRVRAMVSHALGAPEGCDTEPDEDAVQEQVHADRDEQTDG